MPACLVALMFNMELSFGVLWPSRVWHTHVETLYVGSGISGIQYNFQRHDDYKRPKLCFPSICMTMAKGEHVCIWVCCFAIAGVGMCGFGSVVKQ